MPGRERMNHVEVFTRVPCMYYACRGGWDTDAHKMCEACNGKGYKEEWENLRDLLSRMISIGE